LIGFFNMARHKPAAPGTPKGFLMQEDFEEKRSLPEKATDGIISLLSAIVDSSDDAIVSKTLDGIILSWNRAAEQIFGYTAEEAIGQHITLIIPPERHYEEAEVLARVRRGQKIDHFETMRRTKDGRALDISLTVSPIKDGSGRIIGASKVARDITDRKRIEREREELLRREQAARQEAQHANGLLEKQLQALRKEVLAREKAQMDLAEALESRDDFIAVAAHELRNPLNVLVLTLQLLHQASAGISGSPNIQILVDRLRSQLDRLTTLVERLLDVARIRAGKLELFRERFDVVALTGELAGKFANQASNIRVCPGQRTGIEVFWDRIRIEQALTNLVSNAVKYGQQKPITIRASVQGQCVVIRVEDQGIGLLPQDRERIFNRFEQGGVISRNDGLGLGLWVTKTIVEAHGGRVVAESELGEGSVFIMTIPQQGSYHPPRDM
jgi:PAS domain S-box-containing protein